MGAKLKQGDSMVIAGRLVKDVEVREVGANNTPMAKLGVSISRDEIVNAVAWRELAHYAGGLRKGDHVLVIGTMGEPREYNGKTYQDLTAEFIMRQPDGNAQDHDPMAGMEPMQEPDNDMPF